MGAFWPGTCVGLPGQFASVAATCVAMTDSAPALPWPGPALPHGFLLPRTQPCAWDSTQLKTPNGKQHLSYSEGFPEVSAKARSSARALLEPRVV